VLRTEWIKFRTIRGWVVAVVMAGGMIAVLGLLPGMSGTCTSACRQPVGPEGEEVRDTFYFLHRPLTGDGSITVRVSAMTGMLPPEPGADRQEPGNSDTGRVTGPGAGMRPGLVPWAKAGLIVKDGTGEGSAYAAVMTTGAHGVRMQHNYVHDVAGRSGTAPRWLRLTRDGDTVVGEESVDGTAWTRVGTAELGGLPETVRIGMFATAPQFVKTSTEALGNTGDYSGPSTATATFQDITVTGTAGGDWTGEDVGGAGGMPPSGHEPAGEGFTLTGSGDIAPSVAGAAGLGVTVSQTLLGTFAGLVLAVVVGAVFMTGEYRRGMIRTSLTAVPDRGRVLLAKAAVLGAVTFATGLAGAATVVLFGPAVLTGNGVYVHPTTVLTDVRLIVGTAGLLAVAAVLALGIGAVLRRSAGAITAVIVLVVLPYLLSLTALPVTAAQWLLRVTPAAAFAVQQSAKQYHHVDNVYTPLNGFFPLSWWAGFAVLCLWAAAALTAGVVLLRRRDV
jgi:ABC-type transport system involved in multi-copper enzyme maturation permease subunit